MQEVFVLVTGQACMTVDGVSVSLGPGDAIIIQPREVHAMENGGDIDVEYIVFGITLDQGGQTIVV
jgi:mannose-6-phosphate isomerase-like protein (cupin superfamily)